MSPFPIHLNDHHPGKDKTLTGWHVPWHTSERNQRGYNGDNIKNETSIIPYMLPIIQSREGDGPCLIEVRLSDDIGTRDIGWLGLEAIKIYCVHEVMTRVFPSIVSLVGVNDFLPFRDILFNGERVFDLRHTSVIMH